MEINCLIPKDYRIEKGSQVICGFLLENAFESGLWIVLMCPMDFHLPREPPPAIAAEILSQSERLKRKARSLV